MKSLTPYGRNWPLLILTGVALISAAAGASLWQTLQQRHAAAPETMLVLPEPRVIGDFSLQDANGQAFTASELEGRWTLAFFGFTHCPDVCPSTLYDLQQVAARLREQPEAGLAPWQVLFVSVDPERDTPERLLEYLAFFDPGFIGVTGSHEELRALSRRIGIAYRIEEHEDGALQYTVDHSASIVLLDPQGRLHGIFSAPHEARAIGDDMLALLD